VMDPQTVDAWLDVLAKHWILCFVGLCVLGAAADWSVRIVRASNGRR
jgi:hypothetical protein